MVNIRTAAFWYSLAWLPWRQTTYPGYSVARAATSGILAAEALMAE